MESVRLAGARAGEILGVAVTAGVEVGAGVGRGFLVFTTKTAAVRPGIMNAPLAESNWDCWTTESAEAA